MFQSFPRRFVPEAGKTSSEKLQPTTTGIAVVRLLWLAVALVCLPWLGSSIQAQTAEFSQGNKTANVVSLEVPLGSYPGRGMNLPITLHYSSSGLWRIGFLNTVYANVNGFSYRRSVTEAMYAEHSTAGWTTSLNVPEIEWPKLTDRYKWSGEPTVDYLAGYTYRIARVWIHMPDGSTHELRKSDQVYADNGLIDMSGDFYAVDGSRMRYNSAGATTGTLYLSDGTRYTLNGSVTQHIDRNGNTLNYDGSQWTDTMGRHFNMLWPANPSATDYNYSLPGINGSPITYVLKFRTLSTVFIPDVANQTQKPVADYVNGSPPQPVGTSGLFNSGYTGTLEDTDPGFERTFTYVVDGGGFGASTFDPVVLAEIDLPNGQNYKFYYNAYGELDKVTYPTGGYQRYQYGGVATIGISSFPYGLGSRGMLSRWISPSGSGSDEAQWTYSPINWPLTVTAPDASGAPNGTRSETYLFWPQTFFTNNFGYEDARMGLPVEERIYAPTSQGGAMLRRTLIDYQQSSQTYSRPSPGSGFYTAYRNARPIKTVGLILDTGGNALASTTTTGYDATYQFSVGPDATSSSQYDFASVDQSTAQNGAISSIPTGALVRSTQTTNLTGDANYRNRNILGLPASATIYDAASNVVTQSTISYDEGGQYALLNDYGSVTGWTDPGTNVRGNATSHASWLNTTNTWLTTHAQYDQCGSARNAWDAKGNQSQVSYSDSFSDGTPRNTYAYATSITTAVPDPTGQSGSTTALTSTGVFDFYTGLTSSARDANNVPSNPEYNDSLLRLTRAVHASGDAAQTQGTMQYDDVNRTVTAKSDLTTFNDNALQAKTLTDQMGRTIETRTYESDTNYIAVQTQYDSMGRAYKVSNPFRQNETPVWTTSAFDALSRVTSVTTPDGAVVTSSYSGNTATVTDQAGRKRRSVSDALGRVIRVDEPDANGNLDDVNGVPVQSTSYVYDTLDNLRQVNQGSQTRTFVYDSLKRLTSATNPESGTINYQYDPNGDLISKTDARGVVSTYAYDALNRNTTVSYSDGTPTVTRTYDGASNGLGRLWKTETASSSRTTIDSFDALGRPTVQRQEFYANGAWSAPFQTSASYDKAGHVQKLTYPSNHFVNYKFDSAGRLADNAQGVAFNGDLGDGTTRTYSAGISYDNASRWTREQFGTDMPIYNKRHYNIRGQLYDMRASTVNDDSNWNRGAIINYYNFQNYGFGTSGTDNNGNLLIQQHWIPTDDQVNGYTVHQQNYDYDKLNRLTWAAEYLNASQNTGGQGYSYDRYGNRSISAWGDINSQQFTVDTNTNRLGVPTGQSGTMAYDNAGNLTYDSYSSDGPRNYDAENHMTQAWWSYGGWQTYTYDGNGKRTRRNINGSETWQVYGIGGELLAEYSANATPTSPQKEYGYRNGELLITAAGSSCGVGNTGSRTWLGTDGALGHLTGHAEGTNWAVYAGSDSATAMVFGPYDTTYGQGHHTAQFKLMVDNNSGSDVIGSLDVVTGYGGNVLATRQVRRSDFSAANQWQTFTLQFDNPCFGLFEARVWWAGNANMKFAQLTITPLDVATSGVQWLVTDQLGTPRMVFDKTGNFNGVSRHDYLPFGEEVYAGTGGRTSAEGYNTDNVRQHFTGYEADGETGLNFAQARYQSPVQGRFTSVDPLGRSANVLNPQSFNRYSYVENDPLNDTDPSGLEPYRGADVGWAQFAQEVEGESIDPFRTHFGGPEVLGHALRANQTREGNWLAKVRAKASGYFSNDPDAIVTNIEAFMSRDEALAYYRREFGGPVMEFQGKFSPIRASASGARVPNDPPRSSGYVDINVSYGTLYYFLGPTGGVLIDDQGLYPYVGGGFISPGPSAMVSYSSDRVSGGLNGQLQGGPVSIGMDEAGNTFQELGIPTGPSASATVFYVFGAPHPAQHPTRHRHDLNAAINGGRGAQRGSSRNCACNSR